MNVSDTRRTGVERIYLLGLVHGHWDAPPSQVDAAIVDNRRESVNVGIAIVVPAQKILEVLNQPVFERSRNEAVSAQKAENAQRQDTLPQNVERAE